MVFDERTAAAIEIQVRTEIKQQLSYNNFLRSALLVDAKVEDERVPFGGTTQIDGYKLLLEASLVEKELKSAVSF